jgi:hypothetical protein
VCDHHLQENSAFTKDLATPLKLAFAALSKQIISHLDAVIKWCVNDSNFSFSECFVILSFTFILFQHPRRVL